MKRQIVLLAIVAAASGCIFDSSANNKGWDFDEDTGHDSGGGGEDMGSDSGGVDFGFDGGGSDMGGNTTPVTFRMTNIGGAPVFAYHGVAGGAFCGGGAWLEVIEDGVPRRIASDCTRCSCDEEQCAVCALDCAPGVEGMSAQLGPHEFREFTWDGLLRVDDTNANGDMCESMRPPQGTLEARFCWATGFAETFEPFGDLTDVKCETVPFRASDRNVEFELEEPAPDVMRFVLTNSGETPVFVPPGPSDICGYGSWLRLLRQDDTPMRFIEQCGVCSCATVDDPGMCPENCPAIACPAPSREAYRLEPGASREFMWNRILHPLQDDASGMMCELDRLATGMMKAEFCWGRGFDDTTGEPTERQCETRDFDTQAADLIEVQL